MGGPGDNGDIGDIGPPNLTIKTLPRALADINYNSLVAADRNISSDDEGTEATEIPPEDAYTAIGVSISREQTRLTSPRTPAVEKAAAIERAGGFFGLDGNGREPALVEESEEDEEDTSIGEQAPENDAEDTEDDPVQESPAFGGRIPDRSPNKTPVRLPSPWRADSSMQSSKVKSGIFDNLFFNRKRSSTGPGPDTTLTKSFLSSLPSLPNPFSMSTSTSTLDESKVNNSRNESEKSSKRSSAQLTQSIPGYSSSSVADCTPKDANRSLGKPDPSDAKARHAALEAMVSPGSTQSVRSRANLLRKSTSDQSLATIRTLSRVESLGDDSRFEHVQDQVNSRLKAIKDSWQDSNIKLPSLPNISIASFTPDFIRDRSGSLNKRQSIKPIDEAQASSRNIEAAKAHRPVDPMTRQPYSSAKASAADATSGKTPTHPQFKRALEQLDGDVVILGGYRGSILRSADPPHRQLWVPVKVGLNLRKVDLQVGLEEDGDARAVDRIIPGGMLTHIGPVDIARRLFKRLRSCKNVQTGKLRIHDYGYDWRLDPAHLSKQLISFLEALPCNKTEQRKEKRGAIVLAHSLGGLITRHAINQRPELFRGIVYAGVPTTCVNILGPMRNGDEVLLSNRVLTAQVNFSIRTSFALLPLDGRCFFDKKTREEYPVDFFDSKTWIDERLSPCVGRPLPPLIPAPRPASISGYVSSMTSSLPSLSLPGRKASVRSKGLPDPTKVVTANGAIEPDMATNNDPDIETVDSEDQNPDNSVATTVTIPREKAIEYLTRTLASVKKFKQDLAFEAKHGESNAYPPISVIYGKSTPTVYGAKVDGREGIKHVDAYDQLAFASGDGVVLARAAQVPEGYTTARGGVVSSERGHVTLLSDLEAVGKCLNAVLAARRKGIGLGS